MRIAAFAGLSAALFFGLALVLMLVFSTNAGRHAVVVSATVAWCVQVAAFALLWRLRRRHALPAWLLGSGMRLVVLTAYALFAVRAWGLAPDAALGSLAVFFFVSILFSNHGSCDPN